jgi:signal transduction histidine kinase
MLDERPFRQAVLNLLINAQEAMPQGGDIILRTAQEGASTARLDVIDTGIGIPEAEMEHIFKVYYSAKPRGTGLGLPTAKRIIEDHHGELSVTSKPGAGTNFTIRLPLSAGDSSAAP